MNKVYRYEIKTNDGSFKGAYTAHHNLNRTELTEISQKLCNKHSGVYHQSISTDCPKFDRDLHLCACLTVKQLKFWFKGFNTKLIKLGFNLVEYTVESVLVGNSGNQCCFDKNKVFVRQIIK